MANEHPFQMLFETLGRLPIAHAESVNRQAYEILYDILSVPVEKAGRCILLRAPRAGHGKTHLLSRIQHHLGSSHEFIPLHAAFGCQIDAASVIDDTLRRLLRPLPASGGLCVLDLVTRRLFATALQPLVGSGEVPCQDREGALTALRTRPIETFDFHHPNAVTAHWARENFEVLGQRLSVELAQRCGLPAREVAFWVDALFRFASTPVENPVRLRVLADVVHAGNPGDGVLMERLEALLGLMAQLMRVVLVADDLEGFSSDETAALRLAAFLGSLRQSVERLDVILSLNQDIWDTAFMPRLSGGLADRLSEVVVELHPLAEDEMLALLESRVPGLGARVLAKVDRDSAVSHARGLIRAAGVAWLRASAMDARPTTPSAPVLAVAPSPEVLPLTIPEPVSPPPVIETPQVIESPFIAAEPVRVEIPSPEPLPEVKQERGVDPTLAISFLAKEATTMVSPSEQEVTPPVVESPYQVAASAEPPQMIFSAPEATFQPVPETPVVITPVESPFQAAVSEPESPVFNPEPAPAFVPADVIQHATETPVFLAAPELQTNPPAPLETPAAVVFEPAEAPAPAPVPDTDRVDDLLRQFRERYGRGSM
jgi:hypothetical protein